MEANDLRRTDGALRDFARASGLDWVVAEVDRDIADGVTEVKPLRRSDSKVGATYVEVSPTVKGRKRREEFLTQRPMSTEERTLHLIDALDRAVVQTHDIATHTVRELRSGGDRRPPIVNVRFEPDEEFGQTDEPVIDLGEREDAEIEQRQVALLRTTLASLRDMVRDGSA